MANGGPPSRLSQAERRQVSADRLLAAGVELIAEQGFARTTMAQIGARAGYSRETVRLRYGSKRALLEAALAQEYEQRMLGPARDETRSGLDRVLGIVDELRSFHAERPEFLRAVFMVSFESLSAVPELRDHIVRWTADVDRAVAEALRAGQLDGSVDAAIEPVAESHHWTAAAVGLAFRWCQDPQQDLDVMLSEWRAVLVRACAPGSG